MLKLIEKRKTKAQAGESIAIRVDRFFDFIDLILIFEFDCVEVGELVVGPFADHPVVGAFVDQQLETQCPRLTEAVQDGQPSFADQLAVDFVF